jgi:midasin
MGHVELESLLDKDKPRSDLSEILQTLFPRVHEHGWLPGALRATGSHLEVMMTSMKGQMLDSVTYSVKHVLTMFQRVESQLEQFSIAGGDFLSSGFVQQLVLNAVDVYLAHMYSAELKRVVVQSMVEHMNDALQEAEIAPLDIGQFLELLFSQGRDFAVSQQFYFGRAKPLKAAAAAADFVYTPATLRLLESIMVAVQQDEPMLLVGETGTGKTSVVQEMARLRGKTLHVFNMNRNTDSADLLGGFKPVDLKFLLKPAYALFLDVFKTMFKTGKNADFLALMQKTYEESQLREFIQCMCHGLTSIKSKESVDDLAEKVRQLEDMSVDLQRRAKKLDSGGGFVFQFIEGALISSIANGDWVLLDEINLASETVLNKLATIVSGRHILLNERADIVETKRHPNFRLFMCMNPPYTSAGKKSLPMSLRTKLTEVYVPELTVESDLWPIVDNIAPTSMFQEHHRRNVLAFYLWVRAEVQRQTRRSSVGLRNLCRACTMMRNATRLRYPAVKAIYDGLMICFTSHLPEDLQSVISSRIIETFKIDVMPTVDAPESPANGVKVGEHIIKDGGFPQELDERDFILTKSFQRLVNRLASIVAVSDFAVILEGPTSAGKTSTVQYLARKTRNKIFRINNHMHTDVQEYLGSYSPDAKTGKLRFQEGILAQAVRNGYWVILDELNLAPSEVLEALNRLLDDNRELHIVET